MSPHITCAISPNPKLQRRMIPSLTFHIPSLMFYLTHFAPVRWEHTNTDKLWVEKNGEEKKFLRASSHPIPRVSLLRPFAHAASRKWKGNPKILPSYPSSFPSSLSLPFQATPKRGERPVNGLFPKVHYLLFSASTRLTCSDMRSHPIQSDKSYRT